MALAQHNAESSKQIDFVILKEDLDHISSITCVLSMKGGHLMLVGIKSSGRKSLANLAVNMYVMEVFKIVITRTYSFT